MCFARCGCSAVLLAGLLASPVQADTVLHSIDVLDAPRTLVWQFAKQYAVDVQVVGQGAVSGLGDVWQDEGSEIGLEAVPSEYWVFSHWHDGSDANPATFDVTNALDVVAHFAPATTQGVPHSWLASHGLIDPDTEDIASVLAADPDQDGHSTWQEYLAGTDPTNAVSVLRVAVDAGGLTLHNLATGRVYEVKFSPDLAGWSSITNFVVPEAGSKTVELESEGFYRAVVELEGE